jgi:hypothetical protein
MRGPGGRRVATLVMPHIPCGPPARLGLS